MPLRVFSTPRATKTKMVRIRERTDRLPMFRDLTPEQQSFWRNQPPASAVCLISSSAEFLSWPVVGGKTIHPKLGKPVRLEPGFKVVLDVEDPGY